MNLDKLKKAQYESKISLNKISKATGIGYATIHDIFNGKTVNPKLDTIVKITKTLNVDLQKVL